MSQQMASVVLLILFCFEVVLWSVSVWMILRFGKLRVATGEVDSQTRRDLPFHDETLAIERETFALQRDPKSVLDELPRQMQSDSLGMFFALYQIRFIGNSIVLKKTGPLLCNVPLGLYFTEAEIEVSAVGQNVAEVSYRLGFSRLIQVLRRNAMLILFGLAGPLLIVGNIAMLILVAQSPNEDVRWNVFHAFHFVHAIWPVLFVPKIEAEARRSSKNWIDNEIQMLERR